MFRGCCSQTDFQADKPHTYSFSALSACTLVPGRVKYLDVNDDTHLPNDAKVYIRSASREGRRLSSSLFLSQYWQLDKIYLEEEIKYLVFAGGVIVNHEILSAREQTQEHSAERRTPLRTIVTGYISISINFFHRRCRCSDFFVVLSRVYLLRVLDGLVSSCPSSPCGRSQV